VSAERPRVAFVVQRCGEDIAGGAESLCLQTAAHMRDAWDVEILTTCARDARTWSDAYPAGPTQIAGVPARRFSVPEPRDPPAFDRLSRGVARGGAGREREVAWMRAQGPYAPGLVAHLEEAGSAYDRVFFYSYLYATTFFGLPPVRERSVLVPLAHEEWMLGLALFDETFAAAAAFAFVSEEERALVERRFPHVRDATQRLCSIGIDPPEADGARFRAKYGLGAGEIFLSVGRVEEAKGTSELIDYFSILQAADPRPRTLVLVGPIGMTVPERPDIVALGRLDDADKWDALAAATVVCVSSAFESLSLVSLEAWSVGTPVLANGASAVLIGQCRRASGGLWYANAAEFVELGRTGMLGRAEALGNAGRSYVREHYTWDRVRAALDELLSAKPGAGPARPEGERESS
jgi:glycosyltransferase involved in cell wall biosynthesis